MAKAKAGFQIGDIVRLKSGGPNMTVKFQYATGNYSYKCQWFAGKKLEEGEFPIDSLERAPANPPPPSPGTSGQST
ncbi:DUF2158 domain-containing protein [Myxococcus sp. CA040A]|uniref:YodC family protein n=1 Tax=Myxococcus sp. CA040A TaxID=2741738 RepID=UPI00157AFFCE|nr:YodC family protein [Myxococcus sp. CA040A]